MITFIFWWSLCFWVSLGGCSFISEKITRADIAFCVLFAPLGLLIIAFQACTKIQWDKAVWERKP
jgi:hypothetical protein